MLLTVKMDWIDLAILPAIIFIIILMVFLLRRDWQKLKQKTPGNDFPDKNIPPVTVKSCRVCQQSYSDANLANCPKDGTPLEIIARTVL